MSTVEKFKLELTDFEEVALEMKIKKIIINGRKEGLSSELLSKLTGLSIEEIEKYILQE